MENKTPLKEKRESIVISVYLAIWLLPVIGSILFEVVNNTRGELPLMFMLGTPFVILVYRVLVYLFNRFLLLLFRRKIKINRLKGRVTPIYKIEEYEDIDNYSKITKFEVQYTPLNLAWSVPFSVFFEEQEYVKVKTYEFAVKAEDVVDIQEMWEEEDRRNNLKKVAKISAKQIKQQKIEELNKTFNENYK